jgi:hypothetical protein
MTTEGLRTQLKVRFGADNKIYMISGVNITLILFYSAHVKRETYFDPRDLTWKIYYLLRELNGERIS